MSYIARFFKWMMRGIIHFAKELIMFAIRQIISIIRFSLPYILRTMAAALWASAQLAVLGFLSMVRPAPEISMNLGRKWSKAAVEGGWFPSLHELTLTEILTGVAFATIFLGFVLDVFMVVFTSVWLWENGDYLLSLVH
jgi:hypothetical protein